MKTGPRVRSCFALSLGLSIGCGGDGDGGRSDEKPADGGAPSDQRVCEDGQQRGCGDCAPRAGTQYCSSDGRWTGCVCAPENKDDDAGPDDPNDAEMDAASPEDNGGADSGPESDAKSDGEAPTGSGKCKPGFYKGSLHADKWRPGAFDLGGGLTLITATLDAADASDTGVFLSLVQSSSNEETLDVSQGCVVGTMTTTGQDSHPSVAAITGTLNCETGAFVGDLDGFYLMFDSSTATRWDFTGPVTGTFDLSNASIEGEFDAREKQVKPAEDPGSGGEGTWDATWADQDAPAFPAKCSDL